ncbi:MAG: chorismate synthase [Candidatus Cloacimonetes bacterium]|nr:chorismate synthase [Candidatus Cloacimonadota bacterium]
MRGNHFGSFFGITTFGESHGPACGVVLDDVKPGIPFPYERIAQLLAERSPAGKEFSTTRVESDKFRVLSGVFEGVTTGMPVCVIIKNNAMQPRDYDHLKEILRPGHADFSWFRKFKILDYRGGGRASGRETVARVAASALAESWLRNISFDCYPVQIGDIRAEKLDLPEKSIGWRDTTTLPEVIKLLKKARANNDSVGGVLEMVIEGIPAGWGDPVFEKLDANLGKAILSIGGIKGIEFGDGFALAALSGSQANDPLRKDGFQSNHQGGILGGVSTGQSLRLRIAVKPVSSIAIPQNTITRDGKETSITVTGRHDVSLIPRIIPVCVAMAKLALADAAAYQQQIAGESATLPQLREAVDKIDEDLIMGISRRNKIVKQIARLKQSNKISKRDPLREKQIIDNLMKIAKEFGISEETVQELWQVILTRSKEDNYETDS